MKKIFFILVLLFLPGVVSAQSYQYRNYNIDNGLPSSEVYHVFQDSRGYIWFATNMGVSRYDGYDFTHYGIEDGLPDNTIFEIYEDYKGRIWFVSFSLRLSYLYNDSIHKYEHNQAISDYFNKNYVARKKSFYVDSGDNVFIGLDHYGAIKIDSTGQIEELVENRNRDINIYFFKEGSILAPTSFKCKHIILREREKIIDSINFNFKFRRESSQSQYIVCRDSTILLSVSDCIYKYVKGKLAERRCFDKQVIWMSSDRENNLWVGTYKGVFRFNQMDLNDRTDSLFMNKSVSSVIEDNEGGYWFTTLHNGAYYISNLSLKTLTKQDGLLFNNPVRLELDEKNNLWIAYDNPGISKMNHHEVLNYRLPGKGSNVVHSLKYDTSLNKMFLSRWDGVYSFNSSGRELKIEKINDTQARDIVFLRKDTLLLLIANGVLKIHNNQRVYSSSVSNDFRFSLSTGFMDRDGTIYLGGLNGMWLYKNGKYQHLGKKDDRFYYRTTDIKRYNKDFLMASTRGGGLLLMSGDTVYQVTEEDGLLSNSIESFIVNNNDVWVITNKGLSKITYYDITANLFNIHNITKKNGLPTSEINDLAIKDSVIYSASPKGLTYSNLEDLQINNYPPPIYIQNISINGKDTTIKKSFDLKPRENYLSINYKGLCYRSAGNVVYRYKMEGLNNNWTQTTRTFKSFTTLPPGDYEFMVSARNEDGIWSKTPASVSFHIAKPITSQWWFIALIIITIAGSAWAVFNLRVKMIQKKNELIQDINSYKQQILRQQMNPHFIFNTLNSIQYFLLDEDTTSSLTYLAKFAKLMRIILDNSQHTFIPVEDEIRGLELYLELESLRFEKSFDYEIKIDKDINSFNYKIPALLLQPYVENSIRHGLLHKKDKGYLKVHIKKHDNSLFCLIEDNGIGRERSEKIKMEKGPMKKSLGSRITEDRINILNSLYSDEIDVNYRDLTDEKGNPLGTRVEIKLPFVM